MIQLRVAEFKIEHIVKREPGIVPGRARSRKSKEIQNEPEVLESLKQGIFSKISNSRMGRLPVMLRTPARVMFCVIPFP